MSIEGAFTRRTLARHGAREDLRIWRNETGVYWAGRVVGRTKEGHLVLAGATRVTAGLCKGSSDLVGIHRDGGRFIGVELKTDNTRVQAHQQRWIDLIERMGGIVGVAKTQGDVDAILGSPP